MKTKEIGRRLKEIRTQNGFSRKDLSEAIQVSENKLSNWELGRTKIDADYLLSLSEVLNVSVDEILGNYPELMTKDQALRQADPKQIVSRYYSLSERSQGLVDVIIDYELMMEEKASEGIVQLDSNLDLEEDYLAAAHGTEGMSEEELDGVQAEIKKLAQIDKKE